MKLSADLEMAKAYFESCYSIDSGQRLRVGKGGAVPVPRFVLIRTRLGCLWRFRADMSSVSIRELAKLAGREGGAMAPFETAAPPERIEPMVRVLGRAGIEVVGMRELVVCRVGWSPGDSLARAEMRSIIWEQRQTLGEIDSKEWVCFGDLVKFVDVAS
ncbi:MAG: hypothetical protein IH973_02050 [Myxococcales bacterium]|nr:hypothetical protein [Myxococcales bacterium]